MQIIIFGAPGVGKGTQAQIIADKLKINHISTGEILREAIKNKTEIGLKVKTIMDKGELVPDEIMGELVRQAVNDPNSENGFILDGFPRTLNQALILEPILKELKKEELFIIQLEADDDVIVERLSSRRVCGICNTTVNLKLLNNSNKCPNCGAIDQFIKRDDDDESVVRHRLKVYHQTTLPVLEYYKDKVSIININGMNEIDTVTKNILDKLEVNSN